MTTVFKCAVCNQLALAERADALTCSPACRVKAHRTGAIGQLGKFAEAFCPHRNAAMYLREAALVELFGPDADKMIERVGRETPRQAKARWQQAAVRKLLERATSARSNPI